MHRWPTLDLADHHGTVHKIQDVATAHSEAAHGEALAPAALGALLVGRTITAVATVPDRDVIDDEPSMAWLVLTLDDGTRVVMHGYGHGWEVDGDGLDAFALSSPDA